MTAIYEDPCFSVCKVRLWGRIYCDGFQFFYRHYITQEIVAGELVATGRVQRQETDMVEFELSPDEYIAVVQGREGCWTNALELVTSMSRCFRVGGHGSSAFQRKVKLSHEVRGLSHKMHSFRDELCMIVPVWKALPDSEVLELAIRTVESAYQQIEVHQAFCVDLMETFSLVANKIKHFQSRGLIVPNIQGFRELSTDVAQVFEYFTSHVRRTHQAESFVRKTKQSVVEMMAETIRVTSDAIEQLVQSNAPKAWDHERVLVVIELAIQSEQFVCVSSLLARHCKPLSDVFEEYGGKIIQELVKRGELLALQNLVRAHGEVTDEPVPRVLAEYASQSRSLVEMAVQHERLSVLEWLMFEGRMNPFEHGDDIPVIFLAQQVTNKQVRDRMELLLTQAKNRREFEQAAIAFAVSDASAVPLQSLLDLVPKVTSTNDLQVLHTVGKARLQQEDFKTLLLHACNQLMAIGMATDAPGGPMPGLNEAMLHCQQPQKRDRNLSSESSSGEESWCLLAGEAI